MSKRHPDLADPEQDAFFREKRRAEQAKATVDVVRRGFDNHARFELWRHTKLGRETLRTVSETVAFRIFLAGAMWTVPALQPTEADLGWGDVANE